MLISSYEKGVRFFKLCCFLTIPELYLELLVQFLMNDNRTKSNLETDDVTFDNNFL